MTCPSARRNTCWNFASSSNSIKKQTMTLFLGICWLTLGLVTNSEAYFPKNTDVYLSKLNEQYKTNDKELFNGQPVFVGKLRALKEKFELPEQKLLMAIILDAYNRIFTQMQNDTEDDSVKQSLSKVKDQLNQLEEHYYSGKYADLKRFVQEVMALKESDSEVQRKAVFELKRVYNDAAKIGDPSVQNRRRRQAKGPKKNRG